MRKVTADYIFPGNSTPIKNGVVVIDGNGIIVDLIDPKTTDINTENIEKYEGVICPGFINTHCHLELSYLKNQLAEHTLLPHFVKEIVAVRDNYSTEERFKAIEIAEQEMLNNGIVAVGDIVNGNTTLAAKISSRINYHNFVEVFGLNPIKGNEIIAHAEKLKQDFLHLDRSSITPHAPYSVSPVLSQLITELDEPLISIHNQETESENELFISGTGDLFDQLSQIGEDIKTWQPTGKNALPSYLTQFSTEQKILLVHNTYTSQEDIAFAKNYSHNIYWCFCPNANLYIENKLPNFNLFTNEKCTIGTDSLASNKSLSILEEMKIIQQSAPSISLEKIIQWGTFNGAAFLGFEQLGSIEKGKVPGLNWIKDVDLKNLSLKTSSSIQVLN